MPQSIQEVSADTKALTDLLATAKIGDTVAYASMTEAIGRDVQTKARYVLQAATARIQRDSGYVFSAVRNVGMKRLSPEEIVTTTTGPLAKIRRTARRGRKRLSTVSRHNEPLPPGLQSLQYAHASVLGAVEHMARDASVKAADKTIRAQQNASELPLGKMMEVLKG